MKKSHIFLLLAIGLIVGLICCQSEKRRSIDGIRKTDKEIEEDLGVIDSLKLAEEAKAKAATHMKRSLEPNGSLSRKEATGIETATNMIKIRKPKGPVSLKEAAKIRAVAASRPAREIPSDKTLEARAAIGEELNPKPVKTLQNTKEAKLEIAASSAGEVTSVSETTVVTSKQPSLEEQKIERTKLAIPTKPRMKK